MKFVKIVAVTTAFSAAGLAASLGILFLYQTWGFLGAAPVFVLGVSLVVWAEERVSDAR